MPLAQTISKEIEYLPLDTPAAIGEALALAITCGYRGNTSVFADAQGNQLWQIELHSPDDRMITAKMGDVIICDEGALVTMSEVEFLTKYTPL